MKRLFLTLFLSLTFSVFSQDRVEKFYKTLEKEKFTSFLDLFDYTEKENKHFTSEELSKLLFIAERERNELIRIYSLNQIAFLQCDMLMYNLAEEKWKQIIKIAKKIPSEKVSKEILVFTYNKLGFCSRQKLNIEEAINYHQKALGLAFQFKNPKISIVKNIAIAQTSVGEIYRRLQQYEPAIEQLQSAIKNDSKIHNIKGLSISYTCLARCYYELDKLNKSIKLLNKALVIEQQLNSKTGLVVCHNLIAKIYLKKGKRAFFSKVANRFFNKAMEHIEKIFQYGISLKDQRYSIRVRSTLGRIQKCKGELEAAETNLLNSCNIAEKLNYIDENYIENCKELSELYESKKEYEKSIYFLKKAIENEKKTFVSQNVLYISNMISKFDTQEKKLRIQQLEDEKKEKEFESSRTRNILIITLITLSLLGVALYSIYRQGLLNNDKKLLSLEQQALQAQMNPHFVFNALNSIKLYIINNDQRQAVYYLNKFAKLIRNILDISRKSEISLIEELETMDLYVTIENIRFNNEITYECIVEDGLATDIIKIPPLLLQPFLENAIWHGLSSKKDDKKVTLTLSLVDETLLEIKIIDNGVGREKAMSIKKGKSLKRKSVGIDLTQERLKTFSMNFIAECYVKYIDLFDDDGVARGTEVILGVPIK